MCSPWCSSRVRPAFSRARRAGAGNTASRPRRLLRRIAGRIPLYPFSNTNQAHFELWSTRYAVARALIRAAPQARQKDGMNTTATERISRRPRSMVAHSTHVWKSESDA